MIFKERYPHLIRLTKFRFPNYEEIDFRQLLEHIFSNKNCFIDDYDEVNVLLIKRQIKKTDFEISGVLCEKKFDELFFYQPFVGLEGPKHTDINAPVSFLQVGERTIL